jgi:hypothetical protein
MEFVARDVTIFRAVIRYVNLMNETLNSVGC